MPNPKNLPEQLGRRVPMLSAMRYGRVRAGYPWGALQALDYFVVPPHVRSADMVRQAVCRRATRHCEQYQTKVTATGLMVIRIA